VQEQEREREREREREQEQEREREQEQVQVQVQAFHRLPHHRLRRMPTGAAMRSDRQGSGTRSSGAGC